ncbi:MAG: hypothetical protein EOS86_05250 [Mesorhizobium sp.]|nr:MAG: hypothetical protein EOS86_05250 [Mesorhizobium sp.]
MSPLYLFAGASDFPKTIPDPSGQTRGQALGPMLYETVWKLCSGGHLMAFSALPVLTDPNVRCAPVLETTTI